MKEVNCDDCGKNDFTLIRLIEADYEYSRIIDDRLTRKNFHLVQCNHCDLIYLNPRPDEREILEYYPKEYACYGGVPPEGLLKRSLYQANFFCKILPMLKELPDNGVLLEFGCGNGHWLWGMKKYLKEGQRLIGMDFNAEQIAAVKKHGIEAYVGDENKMLEIIAAESVDIVFLNHVIEHVPSPKNVLSSVHRVLKPGGLLIGATPNINAWDAELFGQYWFGLQAPRHFHLFTREKLTEMAQHCGLGSPHLKNDPETAAHWSGSLNTLISEKYWPLPKKVSQVPFYPLLLAVGMMLTFVQMIFSQTSIMTFRFQKK